MLQHYALFGINLTTTFPFSSRLAPATGPADLTFTYAAGASVEVLDPAIRPAYASLARSPAGDPLFAVYRLAESDLLRFAGATDFYVGPDTIVCHSSGSPSPALLENELLGTVLAFWLERQGIAALHASTVVVNGRAVAFLSANGGGKSALAASFVQAGFPLLTDDILPVAPARSGIIARPGYPTMRMWPDEAAWFVGPHEHLAVVHPTVSKRRVPVGPSGFGSFCATDQPLAAVYIPDRRPEGDISDTSDAPGAVVIRTAPPGEAVIELIRHAFTPHLSAAMGWGPRRLELMARLVEQASVRHLTYPSGFERLPLVRDAVLRDLGDSF